MGLGAIGALLAGVRALAARMNWRSNVVLGEANGQEGARGGPSTTSVRALLIGASVALQTGWALFGALSGSRPGVVGATLLAANMALAVPLLLTGGSRVGTAVGACSLLCLPHGIWAWPVATPGEIDAAALTPVFDAAGEIALFILGTGRDPWTMPEPLRWRFREAKITVEVMTTGPAVGTGLEAPAAEARGDVPQPRAEAAHDRHRGAG